MAAVQKKVEDYIKENTVMIFSKTYCPYCKMAKESFKDLQVDFKVLELDNDKDGPAIQSYLGTKTGASSVPRVFINGKCIGGGTETQKLHREKKLLALVGSK